MADPTFKNGEIAIIKETVRATLKEMGYKELREQVEKNKFNIRLMAYIVSGLAGAGGGGYGIFKWLGG